MDAVYRLISAQEIDQGLMDAWRSIQESDETFASPYMCPEFTQAVGRVRDDVKIVVIENANQPIGFFPHQRSRWGMGKPVGGLFSDYHGVIARQGSDWDVASLMQAAKLSVWQFDHLVGDVAKFAAHVTKTEMSPQIELDEFLRSPPKILQDLTRLERKLTREVGNVSFAMHEPDPAVLSELMAWKSSQYLSSNLKDAFSVRWTGALLREIAAIQQPGFAGVCSVLRVNGRMVAVHMGMRSRDTLHYWFPAYDPELAKFSPGLLLLMHMAYEGARMGLRVLDMGKGEAGYKQRLMNGAAELREGAVERPSLLTWTRQFVRAAEARAANAGAAADLLRLPARAMRRIERSRKLS